MRPTTNVPHLAEEIGEALAVARALIDATPIDRTARVERLRRWYLAQAPEERDRLLWRRFGLAEQAHARVEHAIRKVTEALDLEQVALPQARAECEALAAQPLPATIEQEATGARADAVRRYQALRAECREREAAVAELERLLQAHEQTLGPLTECVAGLLEAVVTLEREALVRRLGAELEPIRAWLERLGTAGDGHEDEIADWSRQVGRPLRVPQITFVWPPAAAWSALLDAPVEAPTLVWDDDGRAPRA